MLNGLDLFSGIGGLSIALSEWVRPIAYCEINTYCQAVLLSRMHKKELHIAPIWDDIVQLNGNQFYGHIDIIFGGFPCQDISVAGHGKGLEGERSGLFFEIVRLSKEIKPANLREQVHPQCWPQNLFPTPAASVRGARKNQNGHQYTLQDAIGTGKLNPQWVEWLMGYPIGWTELEPWAMRWWQSRRKKHLKS